ncbi:MAG: hypothetical protein ACLPX9_15420 [Rhodomicrobium sp.]
MPDGDNDQNHHIQYIHFMIGQLQETVKYADAKHAVGMTFVTSLMFASNEFLFKKIDQTASFGKHLVQLALIFAFLALACGFFGIFPRFIAPYLSRRRWNRDPNVFYFKDIAETDTKTLKNTIEKTFPKSGLSPSYQLSGIMEIQALSSIAVRKMRMFELFMYFLSCFLICECILFWQVS